MSNGFDGFQVGKTVQCVCNDASNSITKFRHVLDVLNSFTKRETTPVVEYGYRLRALLSNGSDGSRLVKLCNAFVLMVRIVFRSLTTF